MHCYSRVKVDSEDDELECVSSIEEDSFVIVSEAKHPTSCPRPIVTKSVKKNVSAGIQKKKIAPHLKLTTPTKLGVLIKGLGYLIN